MIHIIAFLANNVIPPQEFQKDIYKHKDKFIINNEEDLLYIIKNKLFSYIPQAFRVDLLERIYTDYRHLGYFKLQRVMIS